MRARALALLALLSLAALIGAQTLDQDLESYLDQVVLHAEDATSPGALTRWPDGVVYWSLHGPRAAEWLPVVRDTFAELNALSARVRFEQSARAEGAMLDIYAGPARQWHPREAIPAAFGSVGYNEYLYLPESGRITSASVLLTAEGLANAERVAREELFQAAGFPGDAVFDRLSITASDTWAPAYTPLDRFWFALAYSGLVRPGASRSTLLAVARTELGLVH